MNFLNALTKAGQFLRLLDEQGQISLTNISVYISLYRLLTVSNASFTEVGTFLMSVLAYNFKKTPWANGSSGTNGNGQSSPSN